MKLINWIIRQIFPPITLAMYSQRQQEDFYFWIHEHEIDQER